MANRSTRKVIELREQLLEMGARVASMVERSIRAMEEGNEGLARQTIVLDRRVNQDEIEIDAACTELIIQGGLDTSEARLVMAAAKIVADLERVSDLAVNICELTLSMEETGIPGDMAEIGRTSKIVLEMLYSAMGAFLDQDIIAAQAVIDRDDELDQAYRAFISDLLGRTGQLRLFIPEQNIAKTLERMGDHATNIAEQVIFQAQGRDVRHVGKRLR